MLLDAPASVGARMLPCLLMIGWAFAKNWQQLTMFCERSLVQT